MFLFSGSPAFSSFFFLSKLRTLGVRKKIYEKIPLLYFQIHITFSMVSCDTILYGCIKQTPSNFKIIIKIKWLHQYFLILEMQQEVLLNFC